MLGTRLGSYEIVSTLGVGGMGEVYRARDTKLGRAVALKILADAFVTDPDRLARFQREAKTLASLNHPNIGGIHGLEEANGVTALVMELVEGEDLAQRIARGAIPVDEALPIAQQLAQALEAAHEQGIVHRDLKPANIKLRPDGMVKVLDFGLAKALAPEPGGVAAHDPTQSPTVTSPAMITGIGLILGTAAYMAPEQAKGRPADKRADVWAFGVVLFEMLTAQRPFTGETISETLASVLKTEPNWRALPSAVPPGLQRLLRRCLEKNPRRRLQAIGEARVQIENVLAGVPEDPDTIATAGATPTWRRVLPWSIAAAGFMAATVAITLWAPWRNASPSPQLRLSAELGADVSLTFRNGGDAVTLSPDGTLVAFVAETGVGAPQLYVRRLTQLQATALSGTDDAQSPFFSPDGRWIAFFADGKLKKIAVTGGVPVTLCDAPLGRGGTWAEDGTIVFAPNVLGAYSDSRLGAALLRVSSDGGTPEPLTSVAEGEVTHRWPQLLPGGKALLFSASGSSTAFNDANLVVQQLPTGTRTLVQRGAYHGRYLPSGHLVYLRDGTLFAAPFDPDRLEITGPPVRALEGVASNLATGSAQFAVSANGTLLYLPGQSFGFGAPIHWMDHQGTTTVLRAVPSNWVNPSFAPDGRRLALQIVEAPLDIWVYEWARDSLTRVTSHPARDANPVWTPDNRRIVFASTRVDQAAGPAVVSEVVARQTASNLYWQRADGIGEAQRLTDSKNVLTPSSWDPSGRLLAFEERTLHTSGDVMILPMEGDEASGWKPGMPTVFLNSPADEREPMFSPDGRWLAYSSNESGRDEVYVQPFRGPGSRWAISAGGGNSPTWSRTKRELFYGTPNGQIMVTTYVVEGESFRPEKPRLWSDGRFMIRGRNRRFDVHPDGERVALEPAAHTAGVKQDKLVFLFNFFDELRRIAPASP